MGPRKNAPLRSPSLLRFATKPYDMQANDGVRTGVSMPSEPFMTAARASLMCYTQTVAACGQATHPLDQKCPVVSADLGHTSRHQKYRLVSLNSLSCNNITNKNGDLLQKVRSIGRETRPERQIHTDSRLPDAALAAASTLYSQLHKSNELVYKLRT